MQNPVTGDVILGGLISKPPLPLGQGSAWKIGGETRQLLSDLSKSQLMEYVYPLRESVLRLEGVQCVVIHDGLPDDVIREMHVPGRFMLEYMSSDMHEDINTYDRRFIMFWHWLMYHCTVKRVWITDVNDVAFDRDPFAWWDTLKLDDSVILSGEEWCPFGHNPWFQDQLVHYPDEYRQLFAVELAKRFPLSCGTFACHRETMQAILGSMSYEFQYLHRNRWNGIPQTAADMLVYNRILYGFYQHRTMAFNLDAGHHGVKYIGPTSPVQHDRETALNLLKSSRA